MAKFIQAAISLGLCFPCHLLQSPHLDEGFVTSTHLLLLPILGHCAKY